MGKALKKIALVGAESSGKSTLASLLAAHYGTVWVPEYARDYLLAKASPCTWDDVTAIAEGQVTREEDYAARADRFLFCDPGLLVSWVWSMYNFGNCPDKVTRMVAERKYDFYFLLDIDIPWMDDGLRSRPDDRAWFHERFKHELEERSFPYVLLSGSPAHRLDAAILALDRLLATPRPNQF